MEWDFKKELKRKAVHLLALSFIVIFVLISVNYGKSLALLALVLLLVIFLGIEYFRLELGKKIPIISGLWREKEKERVGGQIFFLIGSIICFSVFDFDIALAAILMTVFGDMSAALIGKRFGRTWITKDRALEGILAELIVNFVIVWLVFGISGDGWILMCVMAITATIVETLVSKLDDNLMIPLFSGFNGQIIRTILNFLKV
jgi:phytol kinase